MAQPMYPPTRPGQVEVKQIPPLLAYQADSSTGFFTVRNELFRQDVAYLRANDLPMTVPVEADIEPGAIRFLVPAGADPRVEVVGGARLVRRGPRTVVSAGLRGGYTEARFREGAKLLSDWLSKNPSWAAVGSPYAVYWNGPMTPRFLRRSEVHQGIRRRSGAPR